MLCYSCLQQNGARAPRARAEPASTAASLAAPETPGVCELCGAALIRLGLTDALLWKLSELARFGLTAGPPVMRSSRVRV